MPTSSPEQLAKNILKPEAKKQFCAYCGASLETRHILTPNHKYTEVYEYCVCCDTRFFYNQVIGAAIIHLKGGHILLGKRDSSYRPGLWCLPCGYIHQGETVQEGAIREFHEETSLAARYLELFDVQSNPNHTAGIYYIARDVSGDAHAGDDLSHLAYFDMTRLPEMAFPSDLYIINKLRHRKGEKDS